MSSTGERSLLNQAMETISEYVKKKFPVRWTIVLTFVRDEVNVELFDPDDEFIEFFPEECPISDACDMAWGVEEDGDD